MSPAMLQTAHAATVELLTWLSQTRAISRELLCDALAVLGTTAACAAAPEAAKKLGDTLKVVKQQLPARTAAELKPSFRAALVKPFMLHFMTEG